MKVAFKVVVKDVDAQKWAENNNGPWPEDDKRALNTAVRHDIRNEIVYRLQNIAIFEEMGIEVEVQ